ALSTGGQLTVSDVDSSATFVAQAGTAGAYGTFAIAADGTWTYVMDGAHNELVGGQQYVETFAVASADGTASSVTVTITGSNDAAVVSSASVALTETDAALSTGGQLTVSDVDSSATFVAQSATAGAYGTFAIAADGIWTYVMDGAHNELVGGQQYVETFAVASADGTASSVTVTITGSNDAAVVSSATASLTEANAALSTSGQLTVTDVDSSATFVAQAGTAGAYGTFALAADGTWTYVMDGAHNELVGGQQYVETFAVASADGTASSVTVTITGTNDAAVVSSATASLTET